MATLDIQPDQKRLVLTTRTPVEKLRAKSLPGATERTDKKVLSFPAEPNLVADLAKRLGDSLEFTHALEEWYTKAQADEYLAARIATTTDFDTTTEGWAARLYPYQRVGAVWLRANRRAILGDDPGLGKTIQSLTAAGDARRILVVTLPVAKHSVWQRTIEDWTHRPAFVAEGAPAERARTIETARTHMTERGPAALVVNHEMLRGRMSKGKWIAAYPALFKLRWDVLILDEAHKFQDPQTQQSRGAARILDTYRFLLTGTPIWNRPESVWGLLHLVAPNRFSSYWTFIREYCDVDDTQWGIEVLGFKDDKIDRLKTILSSLVLRRTQQEVLPDLPEMRIQDVPYDLTPYQRKHYQSLQRELKLGVSGAFEKLRNTCNYIDDDNEPEDNPKDQAIFDLLETLLGDGRKVVIYAWHVEYARYLGEMLSDVKGYKVWLSHGGMSQADRNEAIETFRHTWDAQVLVATIASTGISIDLVEATAAIFAEGSHVPTLNVQAQKRLHRIGQKSDVMIYRLAAVDSVEEDVWWVSDTRQALSDEVLALRAVMERTLARSAVG